MAISALIPVRPRWTAKLIIAFAAALALMINMSPARAAGPNVINKSVINRAVINTAVIRKAVIGKEVIGHSVQGRPITAWHLGNPHAKKTVVLISQMHGDEHAVRNILTSLRDGAPVTGIDLWLVPRYNPDGVAHDTRQNAHGVDLNRNYPRSWRHTTGYFDSGPKPSSEPETRAMMAFLKRVNPDYVISFHQPLHGVDLLTKHKSFSRKVATALHLPTKALSCNGGCHGTMTMWLNHHFAGEAITVEFGAHPSRNYLRNKEVTSVLAIFNAHR